MITFPLLLTTNDLKRWPDLPRSIPWSLVAPHEAQALHNHDQTLKRLAERGGLDVTELRCAVEGRKLDLNQRGQRPEEDVLWFQQWLADHLQKPIQVEYRMMFILEVEDNAAGNDDCAVEDAVASVLLEALGKTRSGVTLVNATHFTSAPLYKPPTEEKNK